MDKLLSFTKSCNSLPEILGQFVEQFAFAVSFLKWERSEAWSASWVFRE